MSNRMRMLAVAAVLVCAIIPARAAPGDLEALTRFERAHQATDWQ